MNAIYQVIGSIFPIGIKFSFITILLGLIALPIIFIGIFFFGISLIFLPIAILSILVGTINLVAYTFKKNTLYNNHIFHGVNNTIWNYSLCFKRPFIQNSFLEVSPYFIDGDNCGGKFILKDGKLKDIANYHNVTKGKRYTQDDEQEQSSRKDTLWGDSKLIIKKLYRELTLRSKKVNNELNKDHINIISNGDFSSLKKLEKCTLFLQSAPTKKSFFNFKDTTGTISQSTFERTDVSSLDKVNSHIEDRGKKIFITSIIIMIISFILIKFISNDKNQQHQAQPQDICSTTKTLDFISPAQIDSNLKLKKKMSLSGKTSICLFDFYSSNEDNSISLTTVFSKFNKIKSFKLSVNLNYDTKTNNHNLNKIKSVINDEAIKKVLSTVATTTDHDYFSYNKKIKNGTISRKNGYLEINFGHFSLFASNAGEFCLQAIGDKLTTKFNNNLKSLAVNGKEIKIEVFRNENLKRLATHFNSDKLFLVENKLLTRRFK